VTGVIEDFFRRRDATLSKMPRELILHLNLPRLTDHDARYTIRKRHDGLSRIVGRSSRRGRMEAARTTDQDKVVASDPATAPLAANARHRTNVDCSFLSGGHMRAG
jgi:hypothetical protein